MNDLIWTDLAPPGDIKYHCICSKAIDVAVIWLLEINTCVICSARVHAYYLYLLKATNTTFE